MTRGGEGDMTLNDTPRDPIVTVHVPPVAWKGPNDTDAEIFRRVATNLDADYPVGGSNVRVALSLLLRRVATALETGLPGLVVPEDYPAQRCLVEGYRHGIVEGSRHGMGLVHCDRKPHPYVPPHRHEASGYQWWGGIPWGDDS